VELRFFAGLSVDETAEVMNVSPIRHGRPDGLPLYDRGKARRRWYGRRL
jgi:hypothetical protein